jgi:hypothetical protein
MRLKSQKIVLKTSQIDQSTAVQGKQRTVFFIKVLAARKAPANSKLHAEITKWILDPPTKLQSTPIRRRECEFLPYLMFLYILYIFHWPSNYVSMLTIFLINYCTERYDLVTLLIIIVSLFIPHYGSRTLSFSSFRWGVHDPWHFGMGPDRNSYLWLTDPAPDPVFPSVAFKTSTKIIFSPFTLFFKNKKSQRR